MEERQVTIGTETHRLDTPFLVLATQNPLDQEGTYPLPEAQLDRFMLKVLIGYPSKQQEEQIIRNHLVMGNNVFVNKVSSISEILAAKAEVQAVYLEPKIEKYIVDIISATRYPENYGLDELKSLIAYGASPRGSINLALAAKADAYMKNQPHVTLDNVKALSEDVLQHRIGMTYEARAKEKTTSFIIASILNKIVAP